MLLQRLRTLGITSYSFAQDIKSTLLPNAGPYARRILQVAGPEAKPFLNGLITQQMPAESPVYAHFLQSNGRVYADAIIWPLKQSSALQSYLCDVPSLGETHSVLEWLDKHMIQAKVSIRDVSDLLQVQVGSLETDAQAIVSALDPRDERLGQRTIVPASQTAAQLSNSFYQILRMSLGVPEAPYSLISGKSLPLESNLERLNGVAFDKGCYIGQELTVRTHHTGVVRKRVVPVVFGVELGGEMPESGIVVDLDSKGNGLLEENGALIKTKFKILESQLIGTNDATRFYMSLVLARTDDVAVYWKEKNEVTISGSTRKLHFYPFDRLI